jgi:RNA polymerase sigma-70 factor (ECF subfamily)
MRKQDFSKFYRQNVDRVYRFIFFRVGGNKELTEDLVSEVFMKILTHFSTYDPKRSASAWLYTIIRHHLANYFRDRHEDVNIDDIAFSLPAERGEDQMTQRSAQMEVERALDQLPAEDRRLVTMKHLDGYSYKDMAEIFGRSKDALKVATYRAVQKMKQTLKSQKKHL